MHSMMQRVLLVVVLILTGPLYAATRYNVLILYTDEHHYGTLGCYGGTIVQTPHIDALARRGAVAERFYATTPVCSPSRASFLTGLYPTTTGIRTNNIPLSERHTTFAEILRRHGYVTGYAGKWHLAGQAKPGWAPTPSHGFDDNRFMFNRGHWKKLVLTPAGPRVGARNRGGQPSYALQGADTSTYTTDWLTDRAIEFIKAHKDQPWCYMVSYPDPHGPNRVRPPYDAMYSPDDVHVPRSFDVPPERTPAWGRPDPTLTIRRLRRLMPAYYGMVKCIDDNVGRLVNTLRELNLLEQTLIVFTSDHGDLCGEHRRLNKGVPFEGSARIPFVIAAPGLIPSGLRVRANLACVDFLPTLCGLLGLEADVPAQVEGRDASAWFRGLAPERWQDYVVLRSASPERWAAIVEGHYKLVLSDRERPWLFDLSTDPGELENRWNQGRYRTIGRRLVRRLQEWSKRVGDEYVHRVASRWDRTSDRREP